MLQEHALEVLKTGRNVFLTGSAGAGKTYVLNRYIAFLRAQGIGVGVTASTGIAATHIGGMTIHAWSGIGIKDRLTEKDLAQMAARPQLRKRLRAASVLIIDEVSMLAAHVIDMVDAVCKAVRDDARPFGGLQVVFCGDFFQLPPVRGRVPAPGEDVSYDDPFFAAESGAWRDADVQVCYLSTQHRHEDDALTAILNALRTGDVDEQMRHALQQRIDAPIAADVVPTRLYTHNVDVDQLNLAHLAGLTTPGRRYLMTHDGKERLAEALTRACLAPQELIVRIGAAVMFVKNNFDAGYANGTLGTVVDFSEQGFPVVETSDGARVTVEPATWEIDEEGVPLASIRQIPLRLAWAITVHKSQGMTLDAAVMDLSRSFVSGMGYVALSRVRSLRTLSLLGFNDTALMIEERVRELDSALRTRGEETESWIVEAIEDGSAQKEVVAFVARAQTPKKKPTLEVTREMLTNKMPLEAIASQRGLTVETIISHIEKLQRTGDAPDVAYLAEALDAEVVREIAEAFRAHAARTLAPVHRRLGGKYTYDQLRLVRLCLADSEGL